MAITKSNTVVVNDVSLAAGAATVTSGDQDLTGSYRTLVRIRFTNGGTGPTVQCQCAINIAEDTTSAHYTNLTTVFGGTVASAVSEFAIEIPDSAEHLEFVYGSNTGQAVTLRAVIEKITAL